MAKILTEQEIEALRQTLSESKTEINKKSKEYERKIESYDFIAKKHLPPKLMTILTMIFHRFTLNFRGSLSLKLRKVIRMELLENDTLTFNDLTETLPSICWINILNIEALKGSCLFLLESDLALSLVDLLCGGSGERIKRSNLTSFALLEQSLIKKVVELAVDDLREAFNSVIKTDIQLQGVEFNPQLLTIFSPDEFMIIVSIKVSIENISSNMIFAIPHNSLRHLKDVFNRAKGGVSGKTWARELMHNLMDVEVEATVELGGLDITVDQLLSLKEGDMLDINKSISDKITLRIEGIPCFMGHPVQVKGNKGIRIANNIEEEEDESDNIKGEDQGHPEERNRAGGSLS
ncbi:MAG: hypothetical protein DRG39_00535 [Deltaproteobacteria bacterium]|nr:MAG: hypothetical protein DRG39_00535 [Deltaproteobacteria bacterium]